MKRKIYLLFILFVTSPTTISADEVETKADNMAEAIAQQNKKVEEESKAMEKAIDEKGKQVDTKEQEDKFEKASEKVDAMGNAADKKFEQKASLVDKLGNEGSDAIENQAKKVETLSNQADLAEDNASKLVDKIGKNIEQDTDSTSPKARMSISYTLQLPREPHAEQMIQRMSAYQNQIKSNQEAEKTYPWPFRQELHGSNPNVQDTQDDRISDMSLKPFSEGYAAAENDAMSSEVYTPQNMRSTLKKIVYLPHLRLPYGSRHRQHHHHLHQYQTEFSRGPEKIPFAKPTSRSSDIGLLVLPTDGQKKLPEDIRTQMEDDEMLRNAAKQTFTGASNDDEQEENMKEELRKNDAERDMERKWMKINAIGTPEMFMHWSHPGKKLASIGQQEVSIVSPGEVDLLQTEYPDYPKPKALGGDFPGVIRRTIAKKKTATSKKSKGKKA